MCIDIRYTFAYQYAPTPDTRTHTDTLSKVIKYAEKWTGAKTSRWALRPHFHVGAHFN